MTQHFRILVEVTFDLDSALIPSEVKEAISVDFDDIDYFTMDVDSVHVEVAK